MGEVLSFALVGVARSVAESDPNLGGAARHPTRASFLKGFRMSKTNTSPTSSNAKSVLRLTAQRKLDLYVTTRSPATPLGEVVRQFGVHLDDLRQIEQTVESAALAALKAQGRHRPAPCDLSPAHVLQLEQELREKTAALADLSVAYTLLEKKVRWSALPSSPVNGCPRKPGK